MGKWIFFAMLFYIHAAIMVGKGVERIVNYYYNGDYSDLNKYAYVGGDAYNYIINSNIMTSYFVLAASSFVCGTLLIAAGAIIKAIKANKVDELIMKPAKPLEENTEK